MESLNNPVEKLNVLEKKLAHLLELLKRLKHENMQLESEKNELQSRLEQLENSVLKGTQDMEELNQERVLTKMVVDDLIKSIDSLVEAPDTENEAQKLVEKAEAKQSESEQSL